MVASGTFDQFKAVEDALTTPVVLYAEVANQQGAPYVAYAALLAQGIEIVWAFPQGASPTVTAFQSEYGSALAVDTISWSATRSPRGA